MINHERVSEFLIELIKFADEEDIKLLLANCTEKLIKNIAPNNYKIALVHYLFEYINAFIEPKLSILPPFIYEDNTVFRGLQKCVLRNLQGAIADLNKAIQINPSLQAFNDSNCLSLISFKV